MRRNAITMLTLCSLFLFYKYITQLFPSLIGTELIRARGYDGMMLAIMASSFYYTYTFMQVFAGLIIDRYSVRLPMFFAIFIISLMVLLFTHIDNFYLMCLTRALMGAGASFATVLYMKCAAHYTTPKAFSLISSFLATATMLGAACGSLPIGILFEKFGWQNSLNMVAIVGIMLAVAVILQKSSMQSEQLVDYNLSIDNFFTVLKRKNNWLLLMYSGLTFSPVAILGGLWGTPFLMAKYNVPISDASGFLSTMFIGHAMGSPFWAILSAKLNLKKELMHFANVIAFLAIGFIIYGDISYIVSLVLFFIFGFTVGCFMLSFDLCRIFNSVTMMGLSVAFINSGEGIIGSFLEPCIGYALDTLKSGENFSLENYQIALSVLPLSYILSSFMLLFINLRHAEANIKLNLEIAC